MAPPPKAPVSEHQLQGFRYLDHFHALFDRLRPCATAGDKAGNRKLFFDHYACLLLLYFFTPTLTSLRGLQQATALDKVRKRLGCQRTSLGSLAEASHVFDPDLLRPIIAELAAQAVPVMDGREAEALRGLTAVDGSVLPALPKMAWALWKDAGHRAAKVHLHFDVLKGVPADATLTAAACSELAQLQAMLQPDHLYVVDRGYAGYWLFAAICAAGSSFVARVKENTAFRPTQERPLTEADQAAGVIRDVVVAKLGSDHHKDEVGRPLRLVWVATDKVQADGRPEVLLLCTDRLELAAELVALAYRYRWWVELFFRWLKCVLGCRHLLSTSATGVTIQVYMGLIASLLINLWTNHRPNKRTFEMLCLYFSGWANIEELQEHIQKLREQPSDTG
jgi:hypothetical protein